MATCDQLCARPFPADDPAQRQRPRGRRARRSSNSAWSPTSSCSTDPALIRTRTGLNVRQMESSPSPDRPERQRVLELGLTDARFRARLAAFVAETGLMIRASGPAASSWTGRTGHCRSTAGRCARTRNRGRRITSASWDCPGPATARARRQPAAANLAGQPFLVAGPQGPNQLPVTFEVRPDPRRIPGLARFSAQILSEDSGPTGVATSVKPDLRRPERYRVTYRKLRGAGLEPGWHFVRILPAG